MPLLQKLAHRLQSLSTQQGVGSVNSLPILIFPFIAIMAIYPINKYPDYGIGACIGILFIISWLMARFNES
jgi:hypothetical protein